MSAPDFVRLKRIQAGARAAFAARPAPDDIHPMTWERLPHETRRAYLRAAEFAERYADDIDRGAVALYRVESVGGRQGRYCKPHEVEAVRQVLEAARQAMRGAA